MYRRKELAISRIISALVIVIEIVIEGAAAVYAFSSGAPYYLVGPMKLFTGDGSIVCQKNTIKSFYVDPLFSAMSDQALINTVTFV